MPKTLDIQKKIRNTKNLKIQKKEYKSKIERSKNK
jgi:hypothetical protein